MTPILQKLQFKEGQKGLVLNAPKETQALLTGPGIEFGMPTGEALSHNFVMVFCYHVEDISVWPKTGLQKLASGAALWFAYPKKSATIKTDIGRDHGWEVLEHLNLFPVRQVALNENWSALRFRFREEIKELKRGTDYPGINSKAKTVELPSDLLDALNKGDLHSKFESLSFTARKEAVVSLLEAKTVPTRTKRIEKILLGLTSG